MPDYEPCTCASCVADRERSGNTTAVLVGPDEELYPCPECGCEYSYEEDAAECCAPERYSCPECGWDYDSPESADECCREPEFGGDDDYPDLPPLGEFYRLPVPALPARPVRRCSIEQELVDGGARAARLLYSEGIAADPTLGSYSADCRAGQAIVKEDGSLPPSGGEVVYSRFNLADEDHAESLGIALARLRQLKELGLVASGDDAGTHVHISARAEDGTTFQPQHMAALHEVFCHLEDMLYALAACGWREHRLSDYGDGYCKVLPKVRDATPAKVMQAMRPDRYLGLNFGRLFESVGRCRCGACLVGDWEACDCGALDNATVEWRLFNSTTRPETMHAWVIVAHALTAYAAQHTLGTLEPTEIRSGDPDSRWAALEWMLDTAPFTDDERTIVRECARRSPGFGERSDTY